MLRSKNHSKISPRKNKLSPRTSELSPEEKKTKSKGIIQKSLRIPKPRKGKATKEEKERTSQQSTRRKDPRAPSISAKKKRRPGPIDRKKNKKKTKGRKRPFMAQTEKASGNQNKEEEC